MTLTCFRAYEIRGKLGEELGEGIAYRIGSAHEQHLGVRRMVVCGEGQADERSDFKSGRAIDAGHRPGQPPQNGGGGQGIRHG